MIVRDEAETIPKLAASLAGQIDSWCVVDNGPSTDDTEDVCRHSFAGVPGEFYHSALPEFDFGSARCEALEIAERDAPDGAYLLLMDADSPLVGEIPKELLGDADIYFCTVRAAGCEWQMALLVRAGAGIRYRGRAHEYMDPRGYRLGHLEDVSIARVSVGAARERLEWYVKVLSEDLEETGEPRWAFYLGNTLRELGRYDEAVDAFTQRANMDGWDEERFVSMLNVGQIFDNEGRHQEAIRTYLQAAWFRPQRAEPWFYLARLSNVLGEHRNALAYAEHGLSIPPTTDSLMVERWIERWGLYFEAAVAAWPLGQRQESHDAFTRLLERDDLRPEHREACERNAALPV